MSRTTATQARAVEPASECVDLSMAYRRWGALVYTMALRGTGDPATARDVTAEAFAAAWRPELPADQLKVALAAAARRATMAARAAGARSAPAPAADDEAQALLDRLIVRDDLTDLPDPDRTVMLQLVNAGADRDAIAARLDTDPEAVAGIVGRSLRRMAGRLAGSRG